jgi:hypothetical protein
MPVRDSSWIEADREKRQRIVQELAQLKQMSKALRTRSLRSFLKRTAAAGLKPAVEPVATIHQPIAPRERSVAA